MRFIDRIVDNMDAILCYGHEAIWRTNPRAFIDPVTTDNDETFVLRDGTMMTVMRVKGLTSTLQGEEMRDLIYELSEVIGRNLLSNGAHSMTTSFEFDPDAAYEYAKHALHGTRMTARKLGMGEFMDEIMDEKANVMAKWCQVENCYIALYTYPSAIAQNEMAGQIKERTESMRTWPETAEALLNDAAFPQLRVRHKNMVKSFSDDMVHLTSIKDANLLTEVVSVRKYLKKAKQITEPGSSPKWTPRISDDFLQEMRVPVKPRRRDFRNADHMMPPPFGEQLMGETPTTLGLKYAVMGNRVHYGLAVSMGPTEPETFDRLIIQASSMRLPFRICFSFKAKGAGVDYLNTALAKTFPWASSANRQVKEAHNALTNYEETSNGVVPAMYITACTWADAKPIYTKKDGVSYDLKEINDRATKLNRAIQSWGGCQTTDAFAAPIEAAMSTQAGLFNHPLGTIMAPPMPDAIGMSPFFRPTTSWEQHNGNVLFRSAEGRFLHYQQGSPLQAAWATIVVGPMGYGKSTALNTLNLYYLLNPSSNAEMPMLRCLDIGASSRSIVDLVQMTAPKGQENIAKYIRLQNNEHYQINPFDVPLGCEAPMYNQLEYLGNLIGTVCYSMQGNPAVEKMLPGMINAAVTQLYERFAAPKNGGDRARPFSSLSNAYVTEKVDQHGVEYDDRTTWHEIRDELFDAGEIRAALIAHRKAMPILQDMIGVIASQSMQSDYPDSVGGINLLDLFSRAIREAVDLFPMINGETKFELGESRVISLDMEELVPREQTDRARWRASIAFFIGYNILTKDFFFHEDSLPQIPPRYKSYHGARIRSLKTSDKRFSMDERQRFAKIPSAQSQVDGLIAEGRKNKVDIQVASQLFEHHTDQSIRLASTIIILGAGNMTQEESEEVRTRFDLTHSQMQIIRRIRPPSSKGAEAFVIFKTKDGSQAHHVYMTDGPMYLWLIATESIDRAFRSDAFEKYPPSEALRRLGKKYPGGSIKSEIDNRLAELDEFEVTEHKTNNLLQTLLDEL